VHQALDGTAGDTERHVPEGLTARDIEELLAPDEESRVLACQLVYRQESAPSFQA
jgi:hypothetical protein